MEPFFLQDAPQSLAYDRFVVDHEDIDVFHCRHLSPKGLSVTGSPSKQFHGRHKFVFININ